MRRRRFLVGATLAALGGVTPSQAAAPKRVAMLWRTAESVPPGTDRRSVERLLGDGFAGPRGTRDEEARRFAALLEPYGFRLHRNLDVLWFDMPVVGNRTAKAQAVERMVAAQPDCIFEDAFMVEAVARATRTIPIVTFFRDPVAAGLAQSIARPGGNVTGIYGGGDAIEVKSLDFLRRAKPGLACVAWIGQEGLLAQFAPFEDTARKAGFDVRKVLLDSRQEGWQRKLAPQLALLRASGCTGAMLFSTSPPVLDEVATLAKRHGIAIALLGGTDSDIERDGVLLRFAGADDFDVALRRLGAIVARILKGEKPADIPFEGPSRYQLAVNLRTARRIGVTVPPDVRVLADRVVE